VQCSATKRSATKRSATKRRATKHVQRGAVRLTWRQGVEENLPLLLRREEAPGLGAGGLA
jgi:hypothetical protein